MSGISVKLIVLVLRGIPEALLTTLAIHLFTGTKINRKYFLLSFLYIVATYLIRLLPIALGVNTVLSLFVLILCFQFAYQYQMSKAVSTIISAVATVILVAISELLNMLLLSSIFGTQRATELFNSENGLIQTVSSYPTLLFFGLFIYIGYRIIKSVKSRKKANGESDEENRP